MLGRNSDVEGAVRSVRELEDRFNSKYHYPWVFLNDELFSDEFKERVSNVVSGPVEFGLIPHEHWTQPDWIDEEKATAGRNKMVQDNIIYGGSVSYRNMCRFNSGVRGDSAPSSPSADDISVLLQTSNCSKVQVVLAC
jgi:alpha 1,2-mannosyltransferase